MPDVLEVAIDSVGIDESVSTWRVLLNGSELTWTERDTFVHEKRISFCQIDGDLEEWRGSWTLVERSDGLYVDLEIMFDMGIPSLAEVLHPIGERAIRANSTKMLDGIRCTVLQTGSV